MTIERGHRTSEHTLTWVSLAGIFVAYGVNKAFMVLEVDAPLISSDEGFMLAAALVAGLYTLARSARKALDSWAEARREIPREEVAALRAELIAAGVLTAATEGGESARLRAALAEIEALLPRLRDGPP